VPIDEALTKLAGMDTRKARTIELLYFGGLTVEEVSQAMEISPSTVTSRDEVRPRLGY
jgi:DNA-directed RNA polymerase specialized sigma24 family protein